MPSVGLRSYVLGHRWRASNSCCHVGDNCRVFGKMFRVFHQYIYNLIQPLSTDHPLFSSSPELCPSPAAPTSVLQPRSFLLSCVADSVAFRSYPHSTLWSSVALLLSVLKFEPTWKIDCTELSDLAVMVSQLLVWVLWELRLIAELGD
jgi:hypothetical protein